MEKKFTFNTILSKAYKEANATERSKEFLRRAKPHRQVIDTIMNYSKSLSVYHTQNAGVVRLNGN